MLCRCRNSLWPVQPVEQHTIPDRDLKTDTTTWTLSFSLRHTCTHKHRQYRMHLLNPVSKRRRHMRFVDPFIKQSDSINQRQRHVYFRIHINHILPLKSCFLKADTPHSPKHKHALNQQESSPLSLDICDLKNKSV